MAPAGADDSTQTDASGPALLPELLLEIMRQIRFYWKSDACDDKAVWRATLGRMLRVSRTCYELGLPVFLEDLDVSCYNSSKAELVADFLEDGLNMDKFRAVRRLKIAVSGDAKVYGLFKTLLQKVSGNLEELVISVHEMPPMGFYEPCLNLLHLRKLRIEAKPITVGPEQPSAEFPDGLTSRKGDGRWIPYFGLLVFANEMDNIEEFELHTDVDYTTSVYSDVETWAQYLVPFAAKLHEKLSSVSLIDEDVVEWADFPHPSLGTLDGS